jgi:hypothetical protein
VNPAYASPIANLDNRAGDLDGRALSDKSEQVILGILLNTADDITSMLEELPEVAFADYTHRAVYRVLASKPHLDCVAKGIAVVQAGIGNRVFAARGDVTEYVRRLMSIGKGDFGYHARLVREGAVKREVIEGLVRLQSAVALDDWSRVTTELESALTTVSTTAVENGDRVRLRSADGFTMKGTKWLYKGRIPAGMMTILAGREGIGKSTVSLDLVARITKGTLEGRYSGRPQNVILCATEDSWEHTIIPRLRAVGADLTRVFHICVQDEMGRSRPISAPGDTAAIERAIKQHNPVLMVIDPLMAVVDGKVNTNNQQQVQQALEPIVQVCGRTMMSLLALIHVNKSNSVDALNGIMGSKAFTSLPRSVLYCIADPEDDGNFLLTHEKCNVSRKAPSLTYRISSVRFDLPPEQVEEGDEPFIESSRVVWGVEDDRTAADVLAEGTPTRAKGELRAGLLDYINGQNGAVPVQDLYPRFADGELVKKATVDVTLGRMVKKGEVDRVNQGVYQSARLRPSS